MVKVVLALCRQVEDSSVNFSTGTTTITINIYYAVLASLKKAGC